MWLLTTLAVLKLLYQLSIYIITVYLKKGVMSKYCAKNKRKKSLLRISKEILNSCLYMVFGLVIYNTKYKCFTFVGLLYIQKEISQNTEKLWMSKRYKVHISVLIQTSIIYFKWWVVYSKVIRWTVHSWWRINYPLKAESHVLRSKCCTQSVAAAVINMVTHLWRKQ